MPITLSLMPSASPAPHWPGREDRAGVCVCVCVFGVIVLFSLISIWSLSRTSILPEERVVDMHSFIETIQHCVCSTHTHTRTHTERERERERERESGET